jgi:hypothetical protein
MKYRGAHQTSVESWIKRAYVGAVVAYAILALAFVAVAYGQTRQSTIPLPTYTFLRPPSGSSDVVVERYFEYLNLQSVGNLTESYFPNWVGLIEAFGYGAVFLIILYFFVYAWFARRRTGTSIRSRSTTATSQNATAASTRSTGRSTPSS